MKLEIGRYIISGDAAYEIIMIKEDKVFGKGDDGKLKIFEKKNLVDPSKVPEKELD